MLGLSSSWWRRRFDSPAAPITLFAVFAALVITTITRFSVWIDESATLALVAPHSMRRIVQLTSYDAHPPVWYLVLKPWLTVFGKTVLAARVQSALFMFGAFGVWYHFVRTRFSRSLALAALALMVTNPMLLHYAVEGRMYAFATLLTAISCVLITSQWRWRWVAYWLVGVVMLYTHFFLGFVLAAEFLYLAISRREQGKSLLWLIIFGATIVAAFVPWLPYAFHISSAAVSNGFWIPPVTPATVPGYVMHAFLDILDTELANFGLFPILLYFAVFAGMLIRAPRFRPGPLALLWCVVAVPFFSLFALSCPPLVSVFHPRYVIFGLPALITLLGAGTLACVGRWRVAMIAILVAGNLFGVYMIRWRGFNDTRGYWAMKSVEPEISRKIDGEYPTIVCAWLFPFFDSKAVLDPHQPVIHFRQGPPTPDTFPDVLYAGHPDWWVTSLSDIHARHVWLLDELMKNPTDVPSNWKIVTTHRRGYLRTRLFEISEE